jgi:hypothetical protein
MRSVGGAVDVGPTVLEGKPVEPHGPLADLVADRIAPYPLRPLLETPSMMNSWAKMNRISTGTLAITPPTMMVA